MTDENAAIPAARPEPTPSILPVASFYPAEQPAPEPEPNGHDPQGDPDPGQEPAPDAVPAAPDDGAEPEGGGGALEGDAAPDGGEEEGEPISSLPELIEHYEMDRDWFDGLKVPVKVNGEDGEATIAELVSSYRTQQAAEDRLEKAKTRSEEMQQELAQKSQELDGQYATVAKLVESAEKMLDADVADIDWKTLREDDPAEWSAKNAEVEKRRQQIEDMKREAVETWQQTAESRTQQSQEQMREHVEKETAALLEAIPEWKDEETAKAEKTEIAQTLVNDYGFTQEDVMQAADHRLILLARDAMLHRKGRQNIDAAKKKVAKVPKTMKPGSKPDSNGPKKNPDDPVSVLYG